MSSIILPGRWHRQPQGEVELDRSAPMGGQDWAAVLLPGNTLFGSANPVGTYLTNTTLSANASGVVIHQSGTAANSGFTFGANTGLMLSTSSGFAVAQNLSGTATVPIYTTSFGVSTGGKGFYLDLYQNKVRIVKADTALILQSSNTVALNDIANIAWSYNHITGRARIALNGIVTSGTSAQTLAHQAACIGGYWTNSAAGTNPTKVSAFGISPNECLSDAQLENISRNPWQIFKPRRRVLYFDVASGGAATLTPGLLTNSQTFYAPTVTPGAVALTPAMYSNTSTFYSATVTQGGAAQELTPGLFSNVNTFYAPTVTPGSVTLTTSLFSNGQAFYSPSVTVEGGPQTLTPSLVANTSTFYSPTVTPGAVTITPALFANAQTFFAPEVSQGFAGQELTPSLVVNTNQFFTAIVTTGGVTLTPSLLSNVSTFYAPLVTGGEVITATLSAPRGTYSNTQTAIRSNTQTAIRSNTQTARRPNA